MLGTIVNSAAIVVGGAIGILLKKGLKPKLSDAIMTGLALCVLLVGIKGSMEVQNMLVIIVSVGLAAILGALLDLDGKINRLGDKLETRFAKDGDSTFAQGFTSSTLLFCVGAMAIVGSLNSGIKGDHTTLFTKSLLDFIAAILLASKYGAGVLFSAFTVFIYQGAVTLLAQFISPYLTDTVISEMTCAGSLLIIALGLNMLKVTRIKVMDYVFAIFLPIFIYMII